MVFPGGPDHGLKSLAMGAVMSKAMGKVAQTSLQTFHNHGNHCCPHHSGQHRAAQAPGQAELRRALEDLLHTLGGGYGGPHQGDSFGGATPAGAGVEHFLDLDFSVPEREGY